MDAIKEPYHKRTVFDPDLVTLADHLQALSHPARLSILVALARRQGCVTGDLVDELPLAQSTVSRHLAVLKDAGLVQGELEGDGRCYCLAPHAIASLKTLLLTFLEDLQSPPDAFCC